MRVAQNIQEVCIYSTYRYISRIVGLHQSSDLKNGRFFFKKIYKILVHYICGSEKSLKIISRKLDPGYGPVKELKNS